VRFFDLSAVKDISGEEIVPTACSRLIQNFTVAEWEYFFGDEEYKTICPSLPVP